MEKDSEERLRMEYLLAKPVWEPMIMFDEMMPMMDMAMDAGFGGMAEAAMAMPAMAMGGEMMMEDMAGAMEDEMPAGKEMMIGPADPPREPEEPKEKEAGDGTASKPLS